MAGMQGSSKLNMPDELVSIHGFFKGTGQFPIQKYAIFCKFKEIKELRGGVLVYAAQAIPPIHAEIAEKGHLWTETSSQPVAAHNQQTKAKHAMSEALLSRALTSSHPQLAANHTAQPATRRITFSSFVMFFMTNRLGNYESELIL